MTPLKRAKRIDVKIYGHTFASAEERVEWVATEILAAEAAANEEATYWRQMWEKTVMASLGRFTDEELETAKAKAFEEGRKVGSEETLSWEGSKAAIDKTKQDAYAECVKIILNHTYECCRISTSVEQLVDKLRTRAKEIK